MIQEGKEKMGEKRIGMLILAVALGMLLVPLVAANGGYELYCLGQGELLDLPSLCNPAMESRTGPVILCMHNLGNGKICPTNFNTCNGFGLSCSGGSGGNTTMDLTPPEMEIYSPNEGEIYDSRSVLLDVDPNEIASVYYLDNNDNRGKWKQVCKRCSRYTRKRNFKEGENDLMFRVVDVAGNENFFERLFYVDSKEPRMRGTEPRKGFASGVFSVKFSEETPETLVLYYGDDVTGNILGNCVLDRDYECEVEVDLGAYDGQDIAYWFEVTDIAGSKDESKPITLHVDYSDPVINDVDYTIDGKYVYFSIDITEPNLDEVYYVDNSDPRGREKKLCSRLVGNLCEKKVSFKDGEHDLTIFAVDESGRDAEWPIQFFTDSRAPKIKKVEPKKGFASGDFYVEFQEENPVSLIFNYGNLLTGERQKEVIIANDCEKIKGQSDKQKCSVEVDLRDYDGEWIDYWFVLEDFVGNSISKGINELSVDTTDPFVVEPIEYTINRRKAEVVIEVIEENFDEITYINMNDRRPRERRFCSRLKDGMCKKKIRLNEVDNSIDFMVYDEAGNAVSKNLEIEYIVL